MRDRALGLIERDESFLSLADNYNTKRGAGPTLACEHLISRESRHTSPKRVTDMLPPLRRPVLFLDREGLTALGSPVAMGSKGVTVDSLSNSARRSYSSST